MDRELEGADIVVASKVVQIVFVVDVVDLDLVGLALFEVVLDIEALHPGGVEGWLVVVPPSDALESKQ